MVVVGVLVLGVPLCLYFFMDSIAESALAGGRTRGRPAAEMLQQQTLIDNGSTNKIAVVEIQGIISGRPIDPLAGSLVDLVRDQLERIEGEKSIRAVVLKVDSPGGEVLASDEIFKALMDFQERSGKPVVASMGSVAASGGYYVSAPCQWIVANPLTMTGSIGVIFQGVNYRGLMDKVGVRPKTIKSGKLKDMWSAVKEEAEELPEETEILEAMVQETFGRFKEVIVSGRERAARLNEGQGRSLAADWETLADGRILSGKQSFESGFVDELGNLDTALARARSLVGIETANVVTFASPFSFFNMFRLFGEAQARPARVELDLGVPNLRHLPAGRLYYLSLIHME